MALTGGIIIALTIVVIACTLVVSRRQADRAAEDEAYLPSPTWPGAWASGREAHTDLASPTPPADAKLRQVEETSSSADEQITPDVIAGLKKIPPLPQAVLRVLRELEDAGSSAGSIAQIVSMEPVLAATLLRICNSAAYGLRRQIVRLDQAVACLGLNAVKSIVLHLKLARLLPNSGGHGVGYDNQRLWLHSLAVSQLADHLARRVGGVDCGLASTLGLLHDIGKLAINSQFPDAVVRLWDKSAIADESFLARERRLFGADHAFIGGFLASQWSLPADLAEAIRLHHQPTNPQLQTCSDEVRRAVLTVHVANQVAKYAMVYCEDMEIDIIPESVLSELGLPINVEQLMDESVNAVVLRVLRLADGHDECASEVDLPPARDCVAVPA